MILPIKGFFLLSVYLLHFASSSDSVFDLFFDQTETRKARSSALHVTLTATDKNRTESFHPSVKPS